MKKKDVDIGLICHARVSGNLVQVRVISRPVGSTRKFGCVNLNTERIVYRSPRQLKRLPRHLPFPTPPNR